MPTYNTPGVYIEEISKLPPSIVPVATAIPAFIGYTETAKRGNEDLTLVPTEVTSIVEYIEYFGRAENVEIAVSALPPSANGQGADNVPKVEFAAELALPSHNLYYAMQAYFANGGGRCYVVSIGDFTQSLSGGSDVQPALAALEAFDEPTLILCPEAAIASDSINASIADLILAHCKKLQDRFAIIDVANAHPDGTVNGNDTVAEVDANFRSSMNADVSERRYGAAYFPFLETDILLQWIDAEVTVTHDPGTGTPIDETLDQISDTAAGAATRAFLRREATAMLPPSALMAGVYARVDRDRGVWKAPANVGLKGVRKPAIDVTHEENGRLNVDTNGRSVNVIRKFVGKGTLVWGARTLDGNSLEFRYISVRRYFNFVEESAKKATEHFLFEPNDKNTWVKVKSMVTSFLTTQWRDGALAGATPDDAFYVNVGLGETMSSDDVLNGLLRVEIGLAVVRPAEFIVLTFTHKLQTS